MECNVNDRRYATRISHVNIKKHAWPNIKKNGAAALGRLTKNICGLISFASAVIFVFALDISGKKSVLCSRMVSLFQRWVR